MHVVKQINNFLIVHLSAGLSLPYKYGRVLPIVQGVSVGDTGIFHCKSTSLVKWQYNRITINPRRFGNTIFIMNAKESIAGPYICIGTSPNDDAFVSSGYLHVGGK